LIRISLKRQLCVEMGKFYELITKIDSIDIPKPSESKYNQLLRSHEILKLKFSQIEKKNKELEEQASRAPIPKKEMITPVLPKTVGRQILKESEYNLVFKIQGII
jgi:hypothetical protein